ncbi:FtsQ-type POTRA domain-containing protein [Tolypothrix sp. FACHB-123]|uniref:cell division protein FtsQ/DivIB n=1 Tax=Tolypothrix sp. FACHB-123 TaxID=2692868 RepID=UPI001688BC30|nr:FtsQ-type POTRA domain-containing protein [Tolypothrix sp. FACHB-123]MBD2353807.1 FtsQ-type POTRA domain-containing protein [Tolypothrix sp. FACHB-123]
MAGLVSVSRMDLAQRRQKLRRHQQMKIIQAIWRTFAISSLAGCLLWIAIQPMWVLNSPSQVAVKSGNQSLSEETMHSLLGLSYPQSLWRIQPAAIADSLKRQPTIAQAIVTRRLFPPGLIIEIQERVPVAIVQTEHSINTANTNRLASVGLIDANGVLMPLEKYRSLNSTGKLPSLKVIGKPEQYLPYWTQLYLSVSQSSVKVMEIDCQDPTNLILKTELGNVHLGPPSPHLTEQIKTLAQMRHLPSKLNSSQIEYINIQNPDNPLVQLNHKKLKVNFRTP